MDDLSRPPEDGPSSPASKDGVHGFNYILYNRFNQRSIGWLLKRNSKAAFKSLSTVKRACSASKGETAG